MSVKIAVLSQKGGVGKSTLVRALAVEYARNGWQVKIADFDLKQMTSASWSAKRLHNKYSPSLEAQSFSKVNDALKQENSYDLIIFDGAGVSDKQTLELAKTADFIILPSCLSNDDLEPQTKLAHEMVKRGIERKRIGFALSRVGTSKRDLRDSMEYVELAGYKCMGHIVEKPCISQAHDIGLASNETRYESVNEIVDSLIQNIVDKVDSLIR